MYLATHTSEGGDNHILKASVRLPMKKSGNDVIDAASVDNSSFLN